MAAFRNKINNKLHYAGHYMIPAIHRAAFFPNDGSLHTLEAFMIHWNKQGDVWKSLKMIFICIHRDMIWLKTCRPVAKSNFPSIVPRVRVTQGQDHTKQKSLHKINVIKTLYLINFSQILKNIHAFGQYQHVHLHKLFHAYIIHFTDNSIPNANYLINTYFKETS